MLKPILRDKLLVLSADELGPLSETKPSGIPNLAK